jgi:hypothetical protein
MLDAHGIRHGLSAWERKMMRRSALAFLFLSAACLTDVSLPPMAPSVVPFGLISAPSFAQDIRTTYAGSWIGRQTFCSSGCTATGGTYTPDTGTNVVDVTCVGGGGAGGGAASTGAATIAVGGGAGAGGYTRKRITSSFSGVTITVGAAGTPGAAGANAGGNGGNTTFGAILTANGGAGGNGGNAAVAGTGGAGGAGGTASGGDINVAGAQGENPYYYVAVATAKSSYGASTPLGSGGPPAVSTTVAGSPATGYGAGGSGGVQGINQAGTVAGGAGAKGICIVDEYQ